MLSMLLETCRKQFFRDPKKAYIYIILYILYIIYVLYICTHIIRRGASKLCSAFYSRSRFRAF